MESHIKHSYKATLFCWSTVILMGAKCNTGPNSTDTRAKAYQYSNQVLPENGQDHDKKILKRFNTAWESKMKKVIKEQFIKELRSNVPSGEALLSLLPREQQEGMLPLLERCLEFLMEQLVEFGIQQFKDWGQQAKSLCLQLPSTHLESFVPKLEKAQDDEDVIQAFLQVAPDYVRRTFIESFVRLYERIALRFVELIPESLRLLQKEMPKETSDGSLKAMQEKLADLMNQQLAELQKNMQEKS